MKRAKTIKKAASKKQQKKRIIVTSVAVGTAGILGYFGWQYLKRKKQVKSDRDIDAVIKSMSVSTAPATAATSTKAQTTTRKPVNSQAVATDEFPLQKGSKGANVKLLQQALIAKYGKSILPKFGADGDFGSETVSALKKSGLPSAIDLSTFNVLVQPVKVNPTAIGKELYAATISKNYSKALAALKKMQSTADYSTANEVFKEGRIDGVRQTIVNALLSQFTTDAQKQQIKFEFLRIGLQFDGSKWSLSGLDGFPIVTTEPTTVWVNAQDGVNVPAKMVLGNEVTRRLDYTLFENKGKYFLVGTKSVKYLN